MRPKKFQRDTTPGNWVRVDLRDHRWTTPQLQRKDYAEGIVVDKNEAQSQRGLIIKFPWIAEEEHRVHTIPWDRVEVIGCPQHGKKLYYDSKEIWECPFCK